MRFIVAARDKDTAEEIRWIARDTPQLEVHWGSFETAPVFDCVATALRHLRSSSWVQGVWFGEKGEARAVLMAHAGCHLSRNDSVGMKLALTPSFVKSTTEGRPALIPGEREHRRLVWVLGTVR